jgi:hypothetical protein
MAMIKPAVNKYSVLKWKPKFKQSMRKEAYYSQLIRITSLMQWKPTFHSPPTPFEIG